MPFVESCNSIILHGQNGYIIALKCAYAERKAICNTFLYKL